jgi:phage terminase small subunit
MPTALKVLRGNPGKRPLNSAEPKPDVGLPGEPPGLSEPARRYWVTVGRQCVAMGTLTIVDGPAFGTLCELLATQELVRLEKNREGFAPFMIEPMVNPDGSNGEKVREHPALKLERDTATAIRPYFERFGLDPASRSRLHVTNERKPVSKWAGLIPATGTDGTTGEAAQ